MIDASYINSAVMDTFGRLMAKNKLGHAYLFAEPKDSGAFPTALALAQLVNCQEQNLKPCKRCVSCLKIASGNHPDVYVIDSGDRESIKIEDIRTLLNKAQWTVYEARYKVFIIRNTQLMTPEAANALLKTLEEPAANTLMILTTTSLESNLDTIKSRCHIMKFLPLSVHRMTQFLIDEGLDARQARFLAFYTQGSLGKTHRLMADDILAKRQKILDECLHNRRNDEFLKELSADPSKTTVALRLLLIFFRDVVLLKNKIPAESLVFQDRLKELETFARRDMTDLFFIIRQIIAVKKQLDDHLNIRMSLGLLREYLWEN